MRILYLGIAVPNLDEYLTMYTELMVEFRKNGHEVVIAGPAYDNAISGVQTENGFQVIRIPTLKLFNVGKIQKGIANILLPYQYKKALKRSGIDLRFDLVFMPTPPITLTDVTAWLKNRYGVKIYLI
ncbi:MAG: glycosyltransferase WbuB, partial [Eudoraea sp.]|nr:glycosyltransferase WbuB [Eudoraea sp.]